MLHKLSVSFRKEKTLLSNCSRKIKGTNPSLNLFLIFFCPNSLEYPVNLLHFFFLWKPLKFSRNFPFIFFFKTKKNYFFFSIKTLQNSLFFFQSKLFKITCKFLIGFSIKTLEIFLLFSYKNFSGFPGNIPLISLSKLQHSQKINLIYKINGPCSVLDNTYIYIIIIKTSCVINTQYEYIVH